MIAGDKGLLHHLVTRVAYKADLFNALAGQAEKTVFWFWSAKKVDQKTYADHRRRCHQSGRPTTRSCTSSRGFATGRSRDENLGRQA